MTGSDAKLQHELGANGIHAKQLKPVDTNHDGKVTAQETRDYLIQHQIPATQVNSLPPQALAEKLAASLSPEMQRAIEAASACGLSAAIRCDVPHMDAAQIPAALPITKPRSQTAHQDR
jgi:hypothetical protein